MAADIEVGRVDIPVYADTRPFDREIQQDLGRRVEKAARTVGRRMGSELVDALKLQYRAQVADAKEALARGLIDREEFRRQGKQAAEAYNRGVLAEIERLGQSGRLKQHQFLDLADQLKDTGERGGAKLAEGVEQGFAANASRLGRAMQAVLGFVVVREIVQIGRRVINVLRSTADDAEALARSYMEMEAAATLFGLSEERLAEMAGRARIEFELTATTANELTTQATKLAAAAGQAENAQSLLGRALDLGAAQGLDATQTAHALEQALRGLDEGTDKLLQKNPQNIYREWAAQAGIAAGEMTAMQQKQALLTAIMEAGTRVQGRYREFLAGTVGEQVRWRTALQNAREEIGTRMIPVTNRLHRTLAGPLADGVRYISDQLESMLTPLQQVTLGFQELGIEAEAALPLVLQERIRQSGEELEDLQRQLHVARDEFRIDQAPRGLDPNSPAFRGAVNRAEGAPEGRVALERAIADARIAGARAAAEGDLEAARAAAERGTGLQRLLDIEVRIAQAREDARNAEATLEEVQQRASLRADILEIEREIATLLEGGESVARAARVQQLEAEKAALEERLGVARAETGVEGGPESAAARRRRERRERLERDLSDRLFAITATATDLQLRELDRLEEAFREAFGGTIPDAAVAGLERLRAQVRESGIFAGIKEDFEARLAELSSWSPSPQQVEWMGVLREQIQAQLDTMDPLQEGFRDLVDLLEQVAAAEQDAADAVREKNTADDESASEERIAAVREQARAIQESARGALQLAAAFGVVDDEVSQALQGVVQLSGALTEIGALASAGKLVGLAGLGPILAAVGAVATIVGAITGQSADAERIANEILTSQANLIRALDDLRGAVLSDLTSSEQAGIMGSAAALDAQIREREALAEENAARYGLEPVTHTRVTDAEQLADLQRLQEATGVTFISDGNRIDVEAFRAALEAFENLDLGGFTDDLTGQLDALEWTFSILGDAAGDAAERVQAFIDVLKGEKESAAFGRELERILAEEGPEAALAYIDELAKRFAAGDQTLFEKGGIFYGMTAEEVQRILGIARGALSADGGGVTGGGSNVQRLAVSITEAQANQLVSLASTQVYHLAAIHSILAGEGFSPPSGIVPPDVAISGDAGATIVHLNLGDVNVDIDARGTGVTRELARDAGRELGDALGERMKNAWRGAGRHGSPPGLGG